MSFKDKLKAAIISQGFKITDIINELNKRHPERVDTIQNFSGKLHRQSFKYTEIEEILDIIGLKNEWNKK